MPIRGVTRDRGFLAVGVIRPDLWIIGSRRSPRSWPRSKSTGPIITVPIAKRGLSPKDQDLDIVGTSFSPGARRMMARVGAKESFENGRADLEELADVRVTAK